MPILIPLDIKYSMCRYVVCLVIRKKFFYRIPKVYLSFQVRKTNARLCICILSNSRAIECNILLRVYLKFAFMRLNRCSFKIFGVPISATREGASGSKSPKNCHSPSRINCYYMVHCYQVGR